MNVFEQTQQPAKAIIALRARPAALDAKSIALTDDMDVGQVRDAPCPRTGCRRRKLRQIPRRRHRRIRQSPSECSDREIGADDDQGVGERDPGEVLEGEQIAHLAAPARCRPRHAQYPQRQRADQQARRGRRPRPKPLSAASCSAFRKHALGEVAERFAAQYVGGLDDEGVQRPKAALGETEQPPAEQPAHRRHGDKECDRHDADQRRRKFTGELTGPRCGDQRHEPNDHGRNDEQDEPGDD
ncbi:hypothetical protein [Hyphomicrobium album]|uniref:hypothetical protein n=1 Tax=Hyphomicrobium album TaxID=2665159 RepID=UPI002D21ACB8|nr:hypothetical protein [Hyphomicrobium album]